ncbi:hypothetical protein [Streptomyces sp. NPDC006195]|uniref:hypothetical protein n=1 Tax=unclassified Streptomyces TaxID=2593676 RepID=UPI0033B568C5
MDAELEVVDGFRYRGGVEITITKFGELTPADFCEYDTKPEVEHAGLRVSWNIANESEKHVDHDALD